MHCFFFVDITVTIMGNTSVTEGETLSLTCRVESFPPPAVIAWTTPLDGRMPNATGLGLHNGTLTDLWNKTANELQNNSIHELREESGMSTHSVTNVSAADSGQYICRVTYLNTTLEKTADVEVRCKYTESVCVLCIFLYMQYCTNVFGRFEKMLQFWLEMIVKLNLNLK